jgi:hypothetical protein
MIPNKRSRHEASDDSSSGSSGSVVAMKTDGKRSLSLSSYLTNVIAVDDMKGSGISPLLWSLPSVLLSFIYSTWLPIHDTVSILITCHGMTKYMKSHIRSFGSLRITTDPLTAHMGSAIMRSLHTLEARPIIDAEWDRNTLPSLQSMLVSTIMNNASTLRSLNVAWEPFMTHELLSSVPMCTRLTFLDLVPIPDGTDEESAIATIAITRACKHLESLDVPVGNNEYAVKLLEPGMFV